MSLSPNRFLGLELNERLRVIELIEVRPFSLLFKGQVLALERVVGSCSVLIWRSTPSGDPDDIVRALKAVNRNLDPKYSFGIQQVGVIRQGEFFNTIYATGEAVDTTLSKDLAAKNLLRVEDAENVLCQAAKALIPLHARKEVHGRVRPHNLIRTAAGWKLLGLDLRDLEDRLERFARIPEEPVYLPPENYRAGLFSGTVDVWALGICLHLGMCGRLPYSGEGGELVQEVLKTPPKLERLPGRAGSVVRYLLVQEAEQRWGLPQCVSHIETPRGGDFSGRGGGALSLIHI